jgi:DNA-binding response OmpR family regulator
VEQILLCSHSPLFIKNLYGILRDAGLSVDLADHHSLAITMSLNKPYVAVIIDAEQLGLSAEEMTRIIRGILPDVPIIVAGSDIASGRVFSLKAPVDLEEFKEVIHTINHFSKISRN